MRWLRPTACAATFSIAALSLGAAMVMPGCAAIGLGTSAPAVPATAIEKLEYYQFQVKGYQNTYPHRTILILQPVDDRDFSRAGTPDHTALDGDPAVGISLGRSDEIVQRLYSAPLSGIVQKGIGFSAEEAGMAAMLGSEAAYSPGKPAVTDYVLASKITRGWVIKRRGPNGQYGPVWTTSADFALEITVYKPPFSVPFWQGTSDSVYNDPPIGSFGLGPEDEAGVYDDPGEVLSVAMTRAIAGIFQHQDLRALISQDVIQRR